jgi:hypothetical protein
VESPRFSNVSVFEKADCCEFVILAVRVLFSGNDVFACEDTSVIDVNANKIVNEPSNSIENNTTLG